MQQPLFTARRMKLVGRGLGQKQQVVSCEARWSAKAFAQ